MEENNIVSVKDGDPTRSHVIAAPSVDVAKSKFEETVKKKRRRGKSKRKIMKPFAKVPWQDRRKNDNSKRNNRFRNIVLAKTHAPFNNNQFLMEIHKPEPGNAFQILHTPTARTRDSSFSVDSEDNYFFSLPEDEEEYLTKEFSSVYEDAQSERLSNMSKNELVQEYLLLEAKYENLVKRTERKSKYLEEDNITATDKDTSVTDRDSMITDRDTSGTSIGSSAVDEPSLHEMLQRLKEQEEQIHDLQLANEKLSLENEHLRRQSQDSSSEDSESDSSSTTDSDSSSFQSPTTINQVNEDVRNDVPIENHEQINGQNYETEEIEAQPMVNGFHSD